MCTAFCFIAILHVHRFERRASILFTDSQAKISFTSLLYTFAIAMQYTIQKVLFPDFANAKPLITSSKSTERSMSASMQSIETESPISPDPSLFCTGSWFCWVQCASIDGKCCSLLSILHRFATQPYYYFFLNYYFFVFCMDEARRKPYFWGLSFPFPLSLHYSSPSLFFLSPSLSLPSLEIGRLKSS